MLDFLSIETPFTDPVLIFALVMLILFLGPILVERARIPGLVGLIMLGAVVGPSMLGWIERDATFELLGTVGLLYLMFVAGLSIDLNQFRKLRTRSLVFGATSFVLPAILAVVIGRTIMAFDWLPSLLLAAIVGSHTLLAFPIAQRLGITSNTGVTMTLGGTMVTDSVSLVVLAAVIASHEGASGVGFWIQFFALALAFALGVLFLLPRSARFVLKTIQNRPDTVFAFLMSCLFVSAYLATLVKLAPLIGAFLVGLAINRMVPERSAMMTRLRFVGDALLIPFFLVSVGMLVDVSVLFGSLDVWVQAGMLTTMVCAGKGLAALAIRYVYGYTWAEGGVIAGLSIPQAAATLAVTLVGYELGLFEETTVNAVVVMILATCFVGPALVEHFGRQILLAERLAPVMADDAQQRIMIPLANPHTVGVLTEIAVLLHEPGSDQPLYPLAIARGGADVQRSLVEGEKLLGQAVVFAAAADYPVVPLSRIDLNIASGINRAIAEQRISTVVIGWHETNTASEYVFGNVLDQLLDESREMIFVARVDRPINTLTRMFVCLPPLAHRETGFVGAIRALKVLANQISAEITLVTTEDTLEPAVRIARELRPDCPLQSLTIRSLGGLVESLSGKIGEDDMLVLISTRRGTLAWRSALDRLPRILASRFPKTSFLTVYPALLTLRELMGTDERDKAMLRHITRDDVLMSIVGETEQEVISELLARLPDIEAEDVPGLRDELTRTDSNYRPELRSGVAFYHAHVDVLQRTQIVIGIDRDGRKLATMSAPVHVFLLALVPTTVSAEDYLRQLTTSALLLSNDDTVERLRSADDEQDVVDVMTRRYHEARQIG